MDIQDPKHICTYLVSITRTYISIYVFSNSVNFNYNSLQDNGNNINKNLHLHNLMAFVYSHVIVYHFSKIVYFLPSSKTSDTTHIIKLLFRDCVVTWIFSFYYF